MYVQPTQITICYIYVDAPLVCEQGTLLNTYESIHHITGTATFCERDTNIMVHVLSAQIG